MASSFSSLYFFVFFLQLYSISVRAAGGGGELIFEDGYTVSTILNGDKSNIKINPHSVLHESPPSDLFIILDSVSSTFYAASLPITSNETVIKRLAGNGVSGYVDGELSSAKFNKPKSFVVDFNGNLYVADPRNHAIRKITKSGVTTIAGGYSQKTGNADGPARDATFSNDFDLAFIPETCALMVSDHGNRLIRQITLKAEDCIRNSGSSYVLGTTSAWLLGMGLSSLISLAVGFVVRPYVHPYKGVEPRQSTWTWTHWQMNLERQAMMLCSGMRSVAVKSTVYTRSRQIILLTLSHLSLMFRLESRSSKKPAPASLMDLDLLCDSSSNSSSSNSGSISRVVVSDDLKDLITFDEGEMATANANKMVEQEEERENRDVSWYEQRNIDSMIEANLANFEGEAPRDGSPEGSLGLVKRR